MGETRAWNGPYSTPPSVVGESVAQDERGVAMKNPRVEVVWAHGWYRVALFVGMRGARFELMDDSRSYAKRVAKQIAAKLGGLPVYVDGEKVKP